MPDPFAERFLHVDMDAFFVEVERLRDPALRGRPVVVGGLGGRGVVASASYEARAHGVRSAMPMGEARRRCPMASFLPPDHRRYTEVSDRVFAVLHSFTPLVEVLSIDEAFLDIAGLRLHFDSPRAVAAALRLAVREGVGIPASVGISATKFVAKLASAAAKPDGVLLVPAGSELTFLHPLPIDDLWGVGAATSAALSGLGVRTVGDLAAVPQSLLERRLGSATAEHLAALARGTDPREVVVAADARSISVEETFASDLVDPTDVHRELLALCDRLAGRLHRSHVRGRTITLKVRFDDFTTVTRSASLPDAIALRPELWDEARRLLERARPEGRPVRLLGVGVSHLVGDEAPRQMAIDERRTSAAGAAESVRERFGDRAVRPARLAPRPPQGTPGGADSHEKPA